MYSCMHIRVITQVDITYQDLGRSKRQ